MTTTMARLAQPAARAVQHLLTPRRVRPLAVSFASPIACPLMLALLLCAPATRAENWRFTPTLELSETYTDNVALREDAFKQGQWVTEITPGFQVNMRGPRLTMDAHFRLQYFAMPDNDISGTNRSARSGQGALRANVIDDLLYVDASAGIAQRGVSPFGQIITDNNFASANRAEVKTWRVSPYLVHRFGPRANAELRYAHDEVDAGSSGLGNTTGDLLSLQVTSGVAFRTVGWGVVLSQQNIRDSLAGDTSIKNANLNLRYRAGRTLNLLGGIGYDEYDYNSLGGATGGAAWNVGAAWTPSLRTSVQGTVGRRYYGPSRSLSALHRSRHTVWSINFDDSVVSTRSNFLLPATIDTAGLLDRLFMPTYADPAERARAVQEYIRSTGLPASLADNVNFFSNRYSLQKQLRASAAFKRGRSSAVLGLYKVRREALSVSQSDSPILGTNISSLNENVDQSGLNATLNYRLTGRTSFNLVSDVVRSNSLKSGLESRSSAVRFTMRHQLAARLIGALSVRHVEGNGALLGGRSYTENAVSASLSMQL